MSLLTFFVQVGVSYAEPSYPVPPLVLAYSPDGSKIAGCGDHLLRIWDATTGETLSDFPGMDTTFTLSIDWSPDSQMLASASDNQVVRIWKITNPDYPAGHLVATIQPITGKLGILTSVAWSPDGQTLAIGSTNEGYTLREWDINSNSVVYQLSLGWVERLAWHPNMGKNQIAISDDNGGATLVFLSTFPEAKSTSQIGQNISVSAMAWNSDGSQIAIGYEDGGVYVWDSSTNKQIAVMSETDENRITQVAWSPDNTRIAAANGMVRVWESSNGQLLQTLSGTSLSVDFSPDGTHLVYANGGGAIQIVSAPLLPEITLNAPTPTETATPTG